MRSMVEGILRQYGTGMTLQHSAGDNVEVKGFLQPVRSKNWQNAAHLVTPLGEVDRGQYVYIGPAATAVAEGDTLVLGERTYSFRRVEPYYYGDEMIYMWGLCAEKGVNDTWGSQS